jgi:hypothetical protein
MAERTFDKSTEQIEVRTPWVRRADLWGRTLSSSGVFSEPVLFDGEKILSLDAQRSSTNTTYQGRIQKEMN